MIYCAQFRYTLSASPLKFGRKGGKNTFCVTFVRVVHVTFFPFPTLCGTAATVFLLFSPPRAAEGEGDYYREGNDSRNLSSVLLFSLACVCVIPLSCWHHSSARFRDLSLSLLRERRRRRFLLLLLSRPWDHQPTIGSISLFSALL